MSLPLKYRPRRLADILGQAHVKVVLGSILEKERAGESIPPALLFTGSRGTGKTSTARIVAAGLNCVNDTPPCGDCSVCATIFDLRNDSVVEIDAATKGLVADIRELNQVSRLRHYGRYRVFIIDEAHVMHEAAFSALLKQLEEPQINCLYILVTSDVNGVPDTVRSRCLDFPFNEVTQNDIVDGLVRICESEEFAYEDDALRLIAKRAHGGMRDAVVSLEHMSLANDISVKRFNTLWPNPADDFADGFFDCVQSGDVQTALSLIRNTFSVNRNCWQLLDLLVGWLTRNSPFLPAQTIRMIEIAWELRVRSRAENPQEPVLLEAMYFLYLKEVGSPAIHQLVPFDNSSQ